MAFELPLEVGSTGVCATYWRISHIQLDRNAGIVETTLQGYRDAPARQDGKEPLRRLGFRLSLDTLGDPQALALDDIYGAIRRAPDGDEPPIFAAAADV